MCHFIKNPVVVVGQGLRGSTMETHSCLGEAEEGLGRGGRSTYRGLKICNCRDPDRAWLGGEQGDGLKAGHEDEEHAGWARGATPRSVLAEIQGRDLPEVPGCVCDRTGKRTPLPPGLILQESDSFSGLTLYFPVSRFLTSVSSEGK